MLYLRVLLVTNAVLAILFGIAAFCDWWSNPGNWSRSRIAAELASRLPADDVTLVDDEGAYRGEARHGGVAYRLHVWQDAKRRAMHWEATQTDGRKSSGSTKVSQELTPKMYVFPVFVNIAIVAIVAGARVTASAKNIWVRDGLGYLGFAIFLVTAVFVLPYDARNIDEVPWGMWIVKWFAVGVAFFGFGMMSRHVYSLRRSPATSQSAQEHKAADDASG